MKRKRFLVLVWVIYLVPGYISYSQKILYPVLDSVYVRWDNFNIMDGRGGSGTTSLIQDSKGFIWAGNQAGLYRFDGKRYKRFGLGGYNDSTLAGTAVISIFEDSEGIIWAGSYGALNRVDKRLNQIKSFIPDTTDPASHNNSVRLINEDSRGLLWLITDKNIFTFDKVSGKFTEYPIPGSLWHPATVIHDFEEDRYLEDNRGRIWIATDKGLYLYDNRDKSWRKVFPGLREGAPGDTCRINCVETDRAGNIWCGSEKYGLIRITDPATGSFEKIPLITDGETIIRNDEIGIIYIDTTGSIWAYGEGRVHKFNPNTGEKSYFEFPDIFRLGSKKFNGRDIKIRKIIPGDGNSLWFFVPDMGELFHFITEKGIIKAYQIPRYIDFPFIKDNAGCFWIGSVDSRVHHLITDSLPFVSIRTGYRGGEDISRRPRIIEDRESVLRMALYRGGLWHMVENNSGELAGILKSSFEKERLEVKSLFEDSGRNLWVGYIDESVRKYSLSDNTVIKYQLPVKKYSRDDYGISVMQEDSEGNIYICFPSYGLFIIENGKGTIKPFLSWYELTDVREGFAITDFLIDNDDIWIATFECLYKTDINKTTIKDYSGFDNTGMIFGSIYNRICRDIQGNIWILNSIKGPYVFNPENETFSGIKIGEEFYGIYFTDLNFDKYNNLWLTRDNSVIIVDRLTLAKRKIIISPDEIAEVSSIRTKSGKMVYLGASNVYIFSSRVPLNRFVPPVYMTGIYINGNDYHDYYPEDEPVADLEKIVLKHKENHLKLEFAALNFLNPERNRYRYYMSGIDSDTSDLVPDMSVEYRKVAPGNYTFWFTGYNNDGIGNISGKTLDITIRPPWYRSAVAYVIWFLMFASGLAAYIRLRTMRLRRAKIQLEKEVSQRTAELEIKNRQLAEIDETKTRFFTNVSHEIRTPLTLILGPLESLKKEHYGDERQERLLEIMRRNGQRLMQLVTQLLDISKLDSGKMKIILSEGDIVKDLRMLVYEFLSLAESKNIHYLVEIPHHGYNTFFDRDKTEKIVSNLLSNAFKFTPANGTVRCALKISDEKTGYPKLEISVNDSGPGMSAEQIESIFERFYSIDSQHEKDYIGTGIGLSLVREFLTLLHGTIDVNSSPGNGSEFIVSIPLGKEHLNGSEYSLLSDLTKDDTDIHKQSVTVTPWLKIKTSFPEERNNILIIEDNTDLRSFIKENLSEDYNIYEAEDGLKGLNLAMTMIPDLIITDLMMPGMDGSELCTQIKSDEKTSHIPVIMLTAKARMEDRISGLKTGADDYIVKPFNMDELRIRITNLLEQRERLRKKYRDGKFFDQPGTGISSPDDRFMEKVYRLISVHFPEFDFDTDSLHRYLGMSRVHIFRKIKAMTGLSASMLIRNFRLERSAQLLKTKTGNVTEIANSVGISNPSYFTKCFRDYFGISPKDYIKQSK